MVTMAKQAKSRSGAVGQLTFKPAADEGPVAKTLSFIRDQLPLWRDHPERKMESAENRLNWQLSIFLDVRAREFCPMIHFHTEAPQRGQSRADIGVMGTDASTLVGARPYSIYEPFMLIECKRLPAPTSDREREYVAGTHRSSSRPTGGIQRFKLGNHGADVETSAIVGYVEMQTADHWHSAINQWIADLIASSGATEAMWSDHDKLRELLTDPRSSVSSCVSVHRRVATCCTNSIRLHHFWVDVTDDRVE